MKIPRASGVLLHPTSLPGAFGSGDLGASAFSFADFLCDAGQTYWQMLPLGPTGYGDSPYQSFSAFAGNTNLIDPQRLVDDGLLGQEDLADGPEFSAGRVDFGPVIEFRSGLLERCFRHARSVAFGSISDEFDRFCRAEAKWLDDYTLFRALKDANGGLAWTSWASALVRREPAALRDAANELHDRVEAHKFFQFLFFRQWSALKSYCHQRGLKVIGDIPIFVAHDSVDVWSNQSQFKLNGDGSARIVAGVPPDYFSATGQLWGNPIYEWERMKADGFRWWIERMRATLAMFDLVRLDHFRGFSACWEIPGGDETAVNGQWVPAPGAELLAAMQNTLGDLPIIAEDLGVITPEVEALRDQFGFPGMRILQFAFGSDPNDLSLPHNYVPNQVAYTGTHDNDTTVGWFERTGGESSMRQDAQVSKECDFALKYLNSTGAEINWDFIRAVWASVVNTAMVPLQDLLGLDSKARMNLPASDSGNWNWRFRDGDLTPELAERLRDLTETYGRMRV